MLTDETRFRSTALIVDSILIAVLVLLPSSALAVSPSEDFAAWHREWLDELPLTYEMRYTEYFGHSKENPLVMDISNWSKPSYRICVVKNSEVQKEFRVLVNTSYSALIEARQSELPPIWSITQLAPRRTPRFSELSESGGTEPDFMNVGILDKPHTARVVKTGNGDIKIVLDFRRQPNASPRDPRQVIITLVESSNWMPSEIRTKEWGGTKSRVTVEGWSQTGGLWLYQDITIYIQLPDDVEESLHSKEKWNFIGGDSVPPRNAQCYLSYYGLPEPDGTDSVWRIAFFVFAIMICGGIYLYAKRRQRDE